MYKIIIILTLMLPLSTTAIEEYKSQEYQGKSKFQRLGDLENYIGKFSKNFNEIEQKHIDPLKIRIENLEKRKLSSELELKIAKLREDLDTLKKDLATRHQDDMEEIRALIKQVDKNQDEKRDLVTSSIMKRVLILDKIISNMSKLESRPKNITPTK